MAKPTKNITVFGQETEFDGVLEFTDSLVITGKFHGTIRATGDLQIERGAVCNVDKISAESVVVSGYVTGDIEARERIELCAGSKVIGDLKGARLRVADNAEFEGQISMIDKVPDVDLFAVGSKEYKNSLIMNISEVN